MKKLFDKYKILGKILGVIIIAVFFYFLGYLVGHQNLIFEKNYKPTITGRELYKPRTVDFSLFWDAWNKVTEKYVGNPDTQKMINGAISGMVQSLNDPYTIFMEPGTSKAFLEDLSGSITGIGVQIDQKDGKILIVAPLSGSPAEEVGLKPQDQIIKIDNTDAASLSLNDAISKIRGDVGTKVTLTVIRNGTDAPLTFEIIRETIQIKSVTWEMKPGNIAYVQITQFGDDTTDLMNTAAKEIDSKKPKAIILDLRSNPGGYLESSVNIASLFNKNQVVVKEKYKDGHVEENKTINVDPILSKYKTIVLVDGGSASASEILAGALQDWGKATLVGDKTFGKGSVQELLDLKNGATIKITIAKWLTPKDRAIDGTGIEPDVKISNTEEDYNANRDPQLDKALELVK